MSKAAPVNPLLKLALELGPLVVFFIVNGRTDIYWATGIFMIAACLAFVALWLLERKLPVMPLINICIVLVFGGLTLYLHDETFIKMKPTLVYAMFALLVGGGTLFGAQPMKLVMGAAISLDDTGWRILAIRWTLFFIGMALVNEAVWRNTGTDTWVAFKTFGALPITLLFAIAQTPVLNRHKLVREP
jgi:intracellular septation protein